MQGKGQNTYHTPSKTASQKRKAQEEHKSRLPRNSSTRITETIGLQPRLFNRVDHQHAKRRTDARNPVDELDMHV